jgi:hypothetical protein
MDQSTHWHTVLEPGHCVIEAFRVFLLQEYSCSIGIILLLPKPREQVSCPVKCDRLAFRLQPARIAVGQRSSIHFIPTF